MFLTRKTLYFGIFFFFLFHFIKAVINWQFFNIRKNLLLLGNRLIFLALFLWTFGFWWFWLTFFLNPFYFLRSLLNIYRRFTEKAFELVLFKLLSSVLNICLFNFFKLWIFEKTNYIHITFRAVSYFFVNNLKSTRLTHFVTAGLYVDGIVHCSWTFRTFEANSYLLYQFILVKNCILVFWKQAAFSFFICFQKKETNWLRPKTTSRGSQPNFRVVNEFSWIFFFKQRVVKV